MGSQVFARSHWSVAVVHMWKCSCKGGARIRPCSVFNLQLLNALGPVECVTVALSTRGKVADSCVVCSVFVVGQRSAQSEASWRQLLTVLGVFRMLFACAVRLSLVGAVCRVSIFRRSCVNGR